jgi:hypothetical protein
MDFRICIMLYFLFKGVRLSTNIKSTLYIALTRSLMTYACSAWVICGRYPSNKTTTPEKQGSLHYWQISKEHADP